MATTGIHIRHPAAMGIVVRIFFCAVICASLCILIFGSWLVRTRSVSRSLCMERQRGNVAGAEPAESEE